MKFKKPTRQQVLDLVTEGVTIVGTAAVGSVVMSCIKALLPEQKTKAAKAVQLVGSFVLVAAAEKAAEGYLRGYMGEIADDVNTIAVARKLAKADRIVDAHEDKGPNPTLTENSNLVKTDTVDTAAAMLDRLVEKVNKDGKLTLRDFSAIAGVSMDPSMEDDVLDSYGWTDLSKGTGIQKDEDGGALILPPCSYFGGDDE